MYHFFRESGRKLEESVPPSQAVSEERLPQNPRFPVRSRGNSKPPQEISTTIISPTDTPITRIRANNGIYYNKYMFIKMIYF